MVAPNHLSGLNLPLFQSRRQQNSSCSQTHCTSTDCSIAPWQFISLTKNNMFNVVFGLTASCICMWRSQSDTVCDIHNLAIHWLSVFLIQPSHLYHQLTYSGSLSRLWFYPSFYCEYSAVLVDVHTRISYLCTLQSASCKHAAPICLSIGFQWCTEEIVMLPL